MVITLVAISLLLYLRFVLLPLLLLQLVGE